MSNGSPHSNIDDLIVQSTLEGLKAQAKEIMTYSLKPFVRPEGEQFFGGKEGLDVADPLDLIASTGATGYRLFDRLIRRPAVMGGVKAGDKIASMLGEPISSQAELDEAMTRYDPEGVIKGAGYTSTYHYPGDPIGGNYFRPESDSPFAAFVNLSSPTGLHIRPHEGAESVEPITLAEEAQHGIRRITGAPGSGLETGEGRLVDYLTRLREETLAKGSALGKVAKTEGIPEAVASVPSLLSTWLSYALPSSKEYNIGEVASTIGTKKGIWRGFDKELGKKIIGNVGSKEGLWDLEAEAIKHRNKVMNKKYPGQDYETFEEGKGLIDYPSMSDEDVKRLKEGDKEFQDYMVGKLGLDKGMSEHEFYTALNSAQTYEEMQSAGILETIKNWLSR